MTERYELNYDWHLLGPAIWTEESTVTLQVDLHSHDGAAPVWEMAVAADSEVAAVWTELPHS